MTDEDDTPPPVVPLSRQIGSIEQVEAMDDDELERMEAAHEAEIIKLDNRIQFGNRAGPNCTAALRVLRLHKHWVTREIRRRRDADRAVRQEEQLKEIRANREIRKEARQAFSEHHQRSLQARRERIELANDENQRQMTVFKRLVREYVGEAVYLSLWERVQVELKQQESTS